MLGPAAIAVLPVLLFDDTMAARGACKAAGPGPATAEPAATGPLGTVTHVGPYRAPGERRGGAPGGASGPALP